MESDDDHTSVFRMESGKGILIAMFRDIKDAEAFGQSKYDSDGGDYVIVRKSQEKH